MDKADRTIKVNESIDLSLKKNRKKIASTFTDAINEFYEFDGLYTYDKTTIKLSCKIYTWILEEFKDSEFIRIDMTGLIEFYKRLIKLSKGKNIKKEDELRIDILLLDYNDIDLDSYKAYFESEKDKRNGIIHHTFTFKNSKNIGKIMIKYEIINKGE